MPQRRGIDWFASPHRVPGVRHALHTGASPGGADGVKRRGVCSLLELRCPSGCENECNVNDMSGSVECPVPIADRERIQLAHGEGARLTRRLIREEMLA